MINSLSKAERRVIMAAGGAIVAGLVGMFLVPLPNLWKEPVSLTTSTGRQIAAIVYGTASGPKEETGTAVDSGRRPAAVLCHGISCSKELMNTLGYDLARHGFVVLAFDYGGHGESPGHPLTEEANVEDVRAAVAAVRLDPRVDPERVVLVGHSMGATSAAQAGAMDDRIRGVVCLGQKGLCTADRPRNLLQAYGLYDQYHTVGSMARALSESLDGKGIAPVSGVSAWPDAAFGDPGNRALLVSPDGDHASEVYSARMIPEVRNWLRRSVGLAALEEPSWEAWRVMFGFLFGMGVLAGGIVVVARIESSRVARGVAVLPAALTLLAGAALVQSPWSEPVSQGITLLYLVISAGLYCRWRREKRGGSPALGWLKGLVLLATAFAVGSLVGTLDVVVHRWEYVVWAPVALVNIVIHRCSFVFNILRGDLFRVYTTGIVPSIGFAVVMLLEPVVPGLVWRPVGWLADRITERVKCIRFSFHFGARDGKAVAALTLLSVIAVGIVAVRYREGLLGMDALAPAAVVILRMYLAPLAVLLVLVRWAERGKGHVEEGVGVENSVKLAAGCEQERVLSRMAFREPSRREEFE